MSILRAKDTKWMKISNLKSVVYDREIWVFDVGDNPVYVGDVYEYVRVPKDML